MIMVMGTLRITEAELARDVHAILAMVQQGIEVVVEQNHRPVAYSWSRSSRERG